MDKLKKEHSDGNYKAKVFDIEYESRKSVEKVAKEWR